MIDPLGLKVWLAERAIDAPYLGWAAGHTWLVLEPKDPAELKKYYNGTLPWSDNNPSRIVLRGGPSEDGSNGSYGQLIKDTVTDSANQWRQKFDIAPPDYGMCLRYSTDTQFIIDLLEAYSSYQNNLSYDPTAGDRSVPYNLLPFPKVDLGKDYYNSNSFSAGLLVAAGIGKNNVPNPWGLDPGISKSIVLQPTKGP